MDGGAGYPFSSGRTSTKRSFSQMADSTRTYDSLFPNSRSRPQEHAYTHDHRPQRQRPDSQRSDHPAAPHFPGDGLDFRRPVMSTNGSQPRVAEGARGADQQFEAIDLTDDASTQRVQNMGRHAQAAPETAGAAGSSSHVQRQRLPRFDRNIIDLDESDEEHEQPGAQQHNGTGVHRPQLVTGLALPGRRTESGLRRPGDIRPPSPAAEHSDVEVTGSRPRSRVPSRRPTPMPFAERGATPTTNTANDNTIDLTADDDEDLVFTGVRNHGGGINGDRPAMAGSGVGTRDEPDYTGIGIGRLANRMWSRGRAFPDILGNFGGFLANANNAGLQAARQNRIAATRRREELEARQEARRQRNRDLGALFTEVERDAPVAAPVMLNIGLDYNHTGFDMGYAGRARPQEEKYKPPPTTGTGFTRSPGEDEVVVCPNCGDELAVGEGEVKQQMWVNKHCGHAYCGECVTSTTRTRTATKKGKGKAPAVPAPPPFKKCVVKECGKSATKSAWVHVYMSS